MTPPDAPTLRATLAQEYGISRSGYAYARWLRAQGYEGRARQVYADAQRAFVRGLGAALALEAMGEGDGRMSEPRTVPCAWCRDGRAYPPQRLCARCFWSDAAAEAACGVER